MFRSEHGFLWMPRHPISQDRPDTFLELGLPDQFALFADATALPDGLRYAAEFFDELFGRHAQKRRSKFIAALAELQDALGALNDVTVARRTAQVAAGDNGVLAIRAGQVMRRRDRSETHLLRKAVRAYECWLDAKPFWH